jgi:prepilin signal peptidase PulO-like enzyme (type II secretory pathway)
MFENLNFAPLPGSLMAISILGILLTAIYINSLGETWTFTLMLFFIMLFVASFLSLHYGPLPEREIP